MAEGSPDAAVDSSYAELLGEYVSTVVETSRLLDDHGRPAPGHGDEYERLREEKAALRAALDDADREDGRTEVAAILDEAFESG